MELNVEELNSALWKLSLIHILRIQMVMLNAPNF